MLTLRNGRDIFIKLTLRRHRRHDIDRHHIILSIGFPAQSVGWNIARRFAKIDRLVLLNPGWRRRLFPCFTGQCLRYTQDHRHEYCNADKSCLYTLTLCMLFPPAQSFTSFIFCLVQFDSIYNIVRLLHPFDAGPNPPVAPLTAVPDIGISHGSIPTNSTGIGSAIVE